MMIVFIVVLYIVKRDRITRLWTESPIIFDAIVLSIAINDFKIPKLLGLILNNTCN